MALIFIRYGVLALIVAPLLTVLLHVNHSQSLGGALGAAILFSIGHCLAVSRRAKAAAASGEEELPMSAVMEQGLLHLGQQEDPGPARLMRQLEELQIAVHQVFGEAFEATLAETSRSSIWTKGSRTVRPLPLAA